MKTLLNFFEKFKKKKKPNYKETLNRLSNHFLWEIIGERIAQIDQVPIMLKNIRYIDTKKRIQESELCELHDSEPLQVKSFSVNNDTITISFKILYRVLTWNKKKEFQLSITGVAAGTCQIPDIKVYDYSKENFFEGLNGKEILEYKNLVKNIKLDYDNILEVEDLTLIPG